MNNLDEKTKSLIEQQFNEMAKGKSKNKFDFLQLIFSNSELMFYEPVMLRDLILANYEVKPENLIYKSMWRWLSKYRQKNKERYLIAQKLQSLDKEYEPSVKTDDGLIYKKGFKTGIIDVSKVQPPKRSFVEKVT